MSRRLLGGLILLNLCAITLNLSAGQQTITDSEVLKQLEDLRTFIDEKRDYSKQSSKGLKPVLVQYRSNAGKFDGITQCNLSFHDDALHLSIGGTSLQADGTTISILINVEYEFTEYVGYTVKTATLTASNVSVKVSDVKNIDSDIIEQLKCGDIVIKEDESGEHAYLVTFKSETGMCITYTDASVVETQSYDKSGDNWVYNSEDKTDILNPRLETIKDKDGHLRFIEGDIAINTVAGVTKTYGKWSLSGTHLMFVLALDFVSGTVLSGTYIANIDIPKWIYDKIYPLWGVNVFRKTDSYYGDDGSLQNNYTYLTKENDKLNIVLGGVTLDKDRHGRIQLDLLIDNE